MQNAFRAYKLLIWAAFTLFLSAGQLCAQEGYVLRPVSMQESIRKASTVLPKEVNQSVASLIENIQEEMRYQNFPFPVWLFGSATTYGVRLGYEHDIDLAFPHQLDQRIENFIEALRIRLSPTGKSSGGPLIPDRFPIYYFLLPKARDGLDPLFKAANKFAFRITSDSVVTFTRETKSDLYRAAHSDMEKYEYSQSRGSSIEGYYLPKAIAAIYYKSTLEALASI